MGFDALALQLLNGLSHATTLFLMASGLTLIFGVTRIVNFAHGSFFMLGALWSAHALTHGWPALAESAWGYGAVILMGACLAALLGALTEVLLLKRMRYAPQLYQLVATFGLTLALHDAMRWYFGPEEVFAPRFPGLKGAIALGESYFPTWQLFTLALGPLVWLGLHLLLTRTLWGQRVKAATQDREMLDALGVNPAPLMLGVVMLGCGLAGLAGALQLPREPANLQMDVNVVVETFVVVVTGGLGSIGGAFAAAMLIGVIHALGLSFFPQATLVLVFLTMAVVLVWRPQGLAGSAVHAEQRETVPVFSLWPFGHAGRAVFVATLVALSVMAWGQGDYGRSLAEDVMVMMLFGLSLQWMMALGGLVSFGHAAFFALGAYGTALAHLQAGAGLALALAAGMALALLVALVFGALVVRSSGVYLAMLSLALAQMVWAGATQWVTLTGGDNGLIGLRLIDPVQRPVWDALLVAGVLLALAGMARVAASGRGAALQALRDAPLRAAASGLPVPALRYQVFVGSATLAGLAGGLWAAFKGAVFPSVASVATSVDALLVILLGGVHQLWGAAVGSALLVWGGAELGQGLDYWRGVLGLVIMAVMVLAPSGVLGGLQRGLARWGQAKGRGSNPASPLSPPSLVSSLKAAGSAGSASTATPWPQAALQVRGLAKHFGGVRALDGVDFEVLSGQCVALIGPNGAGKSTCFACLAGQHMPTAGQVFWQGQSLLGQTPAKRQRLGVARTFQVAQTFEALTVLQNIQLVLRHSAPLAWWDRLSQRQPERALQLASQVGLQSVVDASVADLPYGAKKRLELAMALAGLPDAGPALLLLDEPAAGLALAERADMMALVRQVAAQGVTVLYTEHNMDAVFGVADRVLVLMQGRLVADGTPEAVAQNPQVRERYLGLDFDMKDLQHAGS